MRSFRLIFPALAASVVFLSVGALGQPTGTSQRMPEIVRFKVPAPGSPTASVAAEEGSAFGVDVAATVKEAFPRLGADEIVVRLPSEPSLRGSVIGKLAEADFLDRNAALGWRSYSERNHSQYDVWRRVNGKEEYGQIKTANDAKKYWDKMKADNEAEYFFVPDDHYPAVIDDLEVRIAGAERGGNVAKASMYKSARARVTKLGRNFKELDEGVIKGAKAYLRLSREGSKHVVERTGGRLAKAVVKRLGLVVALAAVAIESGIEVYDLSSGKISGGEALLNISKIAAGTGVGIAAESLAASLAEGTALPPVLVAVVVGTAAYLVVDYLVDGYLHPAMITTPLQAKDLDAFWPKELGGVPIDPVTCEPVRR